MTDEAPILPAAQNQPVNNLQNPSTRNVNPKNNDAALRNVEENLKFKGSIMPPPTNRAFTEQA